MSYHKGRTIYYRAYKFPSMELIDYSLSATLLSRKLNIELNIFNAMVVQELPYRGIYVRRENKKGTHYRVFNRWVKMEEEVK